MKGYYDIAGDGGSRVIEQVVEQRAASLTGLPGSAISSPSAPAREESARAL
jgi:hypothetical protein